MTPRWRGGELDRLLNARHSALHEDVATMFDRTPGWLMAPEVSFNVYGERGVIDVLAFHPATGSLLVVELKTEIVDVQELVGTMSRKVRLARRIALERGWHAGSVSGWIVVASSTTNRRRIVAHRTMLRAAFGSDGRTMRRLDPRAAGLGGGAVDVVTYQPGWHWIRSCAGQACLRRGQGLLASVNEHGSMARVAA